MLPPTPATGRGQRSHGLDLLVAAVTAAALSQASQSTAPAVTNSALPEDDQQAISKSDSLKELSQAINCAISSDSSDEPTSMSTCVSTIREPLTTPPLHLASASRLGEAIEGKHRMRPCENSFQNDPPSVLGVAMKLTYEEKWERKYKELEAFQEVHGHCDVPFKHVLGPWVSNQRTRHKNGKLSHDR